MKWNIIYFQLKQILLEINELNSQVFFYNLISHRPSVSQEQKQKTRSGPKREFVFSFLHHI